MKRSPSTGAVYERIAGGVAAFNGDDAAMTFASGIGNTGPVTEADIAAVEQFYRRCGGKFCRISASNRSHESLPRMLAQLGYRAVDYSLSWFRPLLHDHRAVPTRLRSFMVPESRWEELSEALAIGYGSGSPVPARLIDIFYALVAAQGAAAFAVEVNGGIVGGGVLMTHNRIAILRTASTKPQNRGNGVQQAVIAARLQAAQETGCAVVFAATNSEGPSAHNLQRLQFQPDGQSWFMTKTL